MVCGNYHTLLSHGTKRNWAKRKRIKLLNSTTHLSHWFEDAFTGWFLKPEHTTKVINDISLLFLKGYNFTMPVLPPMAITDHASNFAHVPHKSLRYTAFPLAILPPYALLLLFLAPFCPSTSLLQHHWASVIAQLNEKLSIVYSARNVFHIHSKSDSIKDLHSKHPVCSWMKKRRVRIHWRT